MTALSQMDAAVTTSVVAQGQAAALIKTYHGVGPVTIPQVAPASSKPIDVLTAQVQNTIAAQNKAAAIIQAHAPTSLPTGKITLNLIRDTFSPVKWADNPRLAEAEACIAWVKNFVETNFCSVADVTITITIGWTYVNGLPLSGGAIGQSMWYINSFDYPTTIRPAFQGLKKNSLQRLGFNDANLPPTMDPGAFYTTYGLGQALGLLSSAFNNFNSGWIGFGAFDYDYTPDGSQCAQGKYSFTGVVLHELFEAAFGRSCNLSYYFGDIKSYPKPLSQSGDRFCSPDGVQVIVHYNQGGGDPGDLAGFPTHSAFDAFGTPGFAPSRSPSQPLFPTDFQNVTLNGLPLSKLGCDNAEIAP